MVIILAFQQNTIWHLTMWEVRRRWTFKWISLDHLHKETKIIPLRRLNFMLSDIFRQVSVIYTPIAVWKFWCRLVNLIWLLSGSEALPSGPWNLTISRSTESCDLVQWSLRDSCPWEPYSTYYRYFEFNSNRGDYTNRILVINRGKFVSSDAT